MNLFDVPLGTGTCQWGDRRGWGYGVSYGEDDVRAAFDASLAAGVTLFDTAELYGRGESERILGRLVARAVAPVFVATKFLPVPWRLRRGDLVRALEASLRRLGLPRVDLYQIHWPFPPVPLDTWIDALGDAVERGLTAQVGVSNFDAAQTERAFDRLARRGIPLASNQIHYSLMFRNHEPVVKLCERLGVRVIAYSPLGRGLLTGRYSRANPPRGRKWLGLREIPALRRLDPVVATLRELAAVHGRTVSQVAINWTIAKGTLPIPGAKSAAQLADNAGAKGWSLSADEVARLDAVSGDCRT